MKNKGLSMVIFRRFKTGLLHDPEKKTKQTMMTIKF